MTATMMRLGRFLMLFKLSSIQFGRCKRKAEDLGIVHKFPEEFFLRQAKSIEELKKTGNY